MIIILLKALRGPVVQVPGWSRSVWDRPPISDNISDANTIYDKMCRVRCYLINEHIYIDRQADRKSVR